MKTSINRPYSPVTMRMHIRDEHPEPQGCWVPKKKHQAALVCCKRPDIADPFPAIPCWLEESVGAILSQLPEPINRYKKNWGVRKHRTLGIITLVIPHHKDSIVPYYTGDVATFHYISSKTAGTGTQRIFVTASKSASLETPRSRPILYRPPLEDVPILHGS